MKKSFIIFLTTIIISHTAQGQSFECSLPYSPDDIQVSIYNNHFSDHEPNIIRVTNAQEFREALLASAQNGMDDKIILSDGVYSTEEGEGGSFKLSESESFWLSIEGESTEGVILDGGNQDIILDIYTTASPTIHINKVTLQNGYGSNGAAIYFDVASSRNGSIIVSNSCIINNESTGQAAAINATGSWSNLINVYIANNTSTGIAAINSFETFNIDKAVITSNTSTGQGLIYSANRGGLITDSNIFDNIVQSNLIYGRFSVSTTRSIFSSNEANAIIQTGSASVINSIFNDNTTQAYLISATGSSGLLSASNTSFIGNNQGSLAAEWKAVNSIFYMNTESDIIVNQGTPVLGFIKNSFFDETDIPSTVNTENNFFDVDGLNFINPTDYDYHLSASSNLIDAGTTDLDDFALPSTDLDGNARLTGAAIDIGPYEFSTTRPTIISFTYTGTAKELTELTFNIDYTLADDGRTLNNIVYDYRNDGNWSLENTHTFDTAGTYTVNAKVTDSKGEFTLKTLAINIAKISLEDKLLTYLSVSDVETILPIINADTAAQLETATTKAMSAGIETGKQMVIDNPHSFGIDVVVPLSNENVESLPAGWQMISVPSKTEDMSVFDYAKIVWYFEENTETWTAYSSNPEIITELQQQGIEIITTVEAGSGVWIEM